MAGFLYAVPEVGGKTPADLVKEYNLGYAFDADPLPIQLSRSGPGDEPATILVDPRRLSGIEPGYYPGQQRWQKRDASLGKVCQIGYFIDHPPKPADLLRQTFMDSLRVRLADGEEWLVPLASALPRPMVLVDGVWKQGPPEGLAFELSELARQFVELAVEAIRNSSAQQGIASFTMPGGDEAAACKFLAANYVIGPQEASILRLFWDRGVSKASEILATGSDWDLVVEALKKKREQN